MNVDKFGRNFKPLSKNKGLVGPPGIGFKLLPSGDFDLESKYLNNVGINPEYPHQAVCKGYVDDQIGLKETSIINHINSSLMEVLSTFNKEIHMLKNHIDSSIKETIKSMEQENMASQLISQKLNTEEKYVDEKIKNKVEHFMKTLFPNVAFSSLHENK